MNPRDTANNIIKSYTPKVKWAMNAVKKVKDFSDSVQDTANTRIIRTAGDIASFSARPAKDFIRNVQGKPIPENTASEQRGQNMVGQGISSGLAKAALAKWGQNLANRSVPAADNASDWAVKYAQVEAKAGWAVPGMKAAFDSALQMGNAKVVRELLPQVPKQYAGTFAKVIDLALQGVRPYTVLKPTIPSLPNLGRKEEVRQINPNWSNPLRKTHGLPNKVPKSYS